MQTPRYGNSHRKPKRSRRQAQRRRHKQQPAARARLTLHETDPITGRYDRLSSLFYEFYQGYTIYSTEIGACCIHGSGQGGCLRLQGKYVVFPDIEDAQMLIQWFLAHGQTAQGRMDRIVPQDVYSWLNRPRNARERVLA